VQTDGQHLERAADRARIHGRKIAVSLLLVFSIFSCMAKKCSYFRKTARGVCRNLRNLIDSAYAAVDAKRTTAGIAGCWLVPGLRGKISKIDFLPRHLRGSALTRDSISGFLPFSCRHCGGHLCFPSHRRTFFECYLLPLFLVRPVRCDACFQRSYRLIFTQVGERPPGPGMNMDLNESTDNT